MDLQDMFSMSTQDILNITNIKWLESDEEMQTEIQEEEAKKRGPKKKLCPKLHREDILEKTTENLFRTTTVEEVSRMTETQLKKRGSVKKLCPNDHCAYVASMNDGCNLRRHVFACKGAYPK